MPTLVITTKATVDGEVIFEIPTRIKLPELFPIPFPPPNPLSFLLPKLPKLPKIPNYTLPSLPCPMDVGEIPPLPISLILKIPGLPSIPFPPPNPLSFLLGKLPKLPTIPSYTLPSLPCPMDIGEIPPLPISLSLKIPGLPSIPFPPPNPLDFLISLLPKQPELPTYTVPSLPCPIAFGIPTIDITTTIEG